MRTFVARHASDATSVARLDITLGALCSRMKLNTSRPVKWGLLTLIAGTLTWGAVRYFDQTQAAAREYVARAPMTISSVGTVQDVTLYKLRYITPEGSPDGCFAEYFFFVSGASGSTHLRALACGSRAAPEFRIKGN
jgi:hypothetical protein